MGTPYVQERIFVSNSGDTKVSLSRPYTVGEDQLRVYLNGTPAVLSEDYTEFDKYTIEFLFPLEKEDKIIIQRIINTTETGELSSFSPQEVHFISDGQTDIVVSDPYVTGMNQLTVYLNGILAVVNEDYEEVDHQTIRFHFQLSSDDIVITEHRVYFDDKKITVIGDKNRSMFQQYGELQTLLPTQKYTVTFTHDDQLFTKEFYTRMDPSYSTIRIIRGDVGEVFNSVRDPQLAFQIYQNSVLANNIASEENLTLLEDEEKIPYVFKQYVRYRTELDLLIAIYMAISGRGSTEKKVLGELEIEYKWRLSDIKPLLEELKQKLKPWEKQLTGKTAASLVASAVRGGSSNAFELTSPRRNFADGTGGGS